MYEVCEVEVEFTHSDANVVRVDAQVWVGTLRRLGKAFAVSALQWYRPEEDDHDEIESPHLVRLAQAVYTSHLALLIGIAEDATRRALPRDAQHETLAILGRDVLAQLR